MLYSLCNFATDLRMDPEHAARKSFKEIQKLAPDWVPDFDSLYNFPPDSRMSALARFDIASGRIVETSLLPLWIDRDAVPRVLAPDDERFGKVLEYLRAVTREAELNASFQVRGDRVVVGVAA